MNHEDKKNDSTALVERISRLHGDISSLGVDAIETLEYWGSYDVLSKFDGGMVADVYLIRLNNTLAVARFGTRSESYLRWEIDLIELLDRSGLRVPQFIRTSDGRAHVRGVTVMEYIEGREASTSSDESAVCDYLAKVHKATLNYPQRPLCISTSDVAQDATGENLDLSALPKDKFELCRTSWAALPKHDTSVVHGDPSSSNARVTDDGVVLFDWDEARVDFSIIDFGYAPSDVAGLGENYKVARRAYMAWDAAVCWSLEKGRRWAEEEFDQLASTPTHETPPG